MREIMEKIFFNINDKNYVANIQTSGSFSGLNKLLNKQSDFALISQDVTKWKNTSKYNQEFKNLKIKTIALGEEAILLLYKQPEECTDKLVMSSNNVKKIYSLFSGHKNTGDGEFDDYKTLVNSTNDKCSANITTFTRTGGPDKSGTAYSFFHANPLFSTEGTQDEWTKKVLSSTTGKDFKNLKIKYTPESNALSFDHFTRDKSRASMIYLSASFVIANWKKIEDLKIKVADFKKDSSSTSSINKDNWETEIIQKNYTWVRKLNLLYSIADINESKKEFIKKITKNTSIIKNSYVVPTSFVENGECETDNDNSKNAKCYKNEQLFSYDKNEYGTVKTSSN